METRFYFVHAITPLHAGTGQGAGHIDLPIQRERASQHPVLPGSSFKGAIRDRVEQALDRARTEAMLGPRPPGGDDSPEASHFASPLRFSDARLLLLPVQSDRGTFAWVTSPTLLSRLQRDGAGALGSELDKLPLPSPTDTTCVVCKDSALVDGKRVVLDGLGFARAEGQADAWARALAGLVFDAQAPHAATWRGLLGKRFCVVDDDTFTWLAQQATEVRARIRIDHATGTVKGGALWYEESLPSEAVLVGMVQYVGHKKAAKAATCWKDLAGVLAQPVQLGGKATIGQGLCRVSLTGGAA